MKLSRLILIFFVLALYLISSCGGNPTASEKPVNPLDLTPRENAEAEEAALFLSGDLIAPQDMYKRLLHGFSLLRDKYSDSIPEVNIPFILPTSTSIFKLGMSDSAAIEFRVNNYDAWDSLNALYSFSVSDTNTFPWGFRVWLKSNGRYNLHDICDMYDMLPGIDWTYPGYYGDDRPITFPWIDSVGNLVFLVRDAWGDCPAGCDHGHLFYFKMRSGDIEFIGDWGPYGPESHPPEPDWMDEISAIGKAYWYYPDYSPCFTAPAVHR